MIKYDDTDERKDGTNKKICILICVIFFLIGIIIHKKEEYEDQRVKTGPGVK